jgi:mono/diheme cytochrome c family protein
VRSFLLGAALIAAFLFGARPAIEAIEGANGPNPCGRALPVPAELRLPQYVPSGEPVAIEQTMLDYLSSYRYRQLGWCLDKSVRDTGPYIHGISYGVHPAVRIYYSPEIIEWLRNGRRGMPRDGAVIIKEQYPGKPAAAFAGATNEELRPTDWTIMIRRASASHDGWFWGELYEGMFGEKPTRAHYPLAGFGIYCLRCHASAEKAMTFVSLENVEGYPGSPLHYFIDNSWRVKQPPAPSIESPSTPGPLSARSPLPLQTFPPESIDTSLARAHGTQLFLTSDQCMSCHSAAPKLPFGPLMWVRGVNVSEYGEWRWSPMALAGRDPVFYAQFESEMAYLDSIADPHARSALRSQVAGICSTCHTVMAKRQLAADHPKLTFTPEMVFDAEPSHWNYHYGGLARDGISCAVCHHVEQTRTPAGQSALAYFLNHKINGAFDLTPPVKLYGPFKDSAIVTHAMNEALGVKPRYSAYTTSSRLCASCHTINLPIVDAVPVAAVPKEHSVEQATYLEWLNSRYQNEYGALPGAKSCQDCHMPAGIRDDAQGLALTHIATKIALIQDNSYPKTTNAASKTDLNVRVRQSGFRRHELLGLNAFLLTLFKQYPDVLGVRLNDYMTGFSGDLDRAIAHVVQQARTATATVKIRTHLSGRKLIADVEVINLTGHRFPSGVGFRRAFLDFEVRDASNSRAAPIFVSGRADARGRILGPNGVLPSEFFAAGPDGRQQFQDHFDEAHPITRPDQVQIFEELTRDHSGRFTTSFIRRDEEVKDNRLLPQGWTRNGPTPDLPAYFLHATYPVGRAATDPRYLDGRGHAIVRYVVALPASVDPKHVRVDATLYYQSWEPAFIAERASGSGPAATRFAVLTDRLSLQNTPLAGWKIRIASRSARVR